ncbi:unnamed protein product [Prorocentrum cordatum]|nr:unnamed protein product [Polarella glacialis]
MPSRSPSGPRADTPSEQQSMVEVVPQRSGPRIDSPSDEGGLWAQMASPRDAPRVLRQKSAPLVGKAKSLGLMSSCSGSSGSTLAMATSVGGLKCQLADQLLRYHRLLPEEDAPTSPHRLLFGRQHTNTSISSQRGDPFSGVMADGDGNGMLASGQGDNPCSSQSQSLRTLVTTVGSRLSDLNPLSEANQNQVEELRHRRVSELTSQFGSAGSDPSVAARVPALELLWVFGVLPPPGRHSVRLRRRSAASLYQALVCVLATLACFEMVAASLRMDASRGLRQFEHGVQTGLLSDMALAAGSLIGLLMVGAPFGSKSLRECIQLLLSISAADGTQLKLGKRMRRELVGLVLIWVAATAWRILESARSSHEIFSWKVLGVLSFALVSGVLLSLALTMICVCHALAIMIDNFCVHVSESQSCRRQIMIAAQEWNVLQAVLRKASRSIEYCFFTLQTASWFAVLFGYIDVTYGSDSLVVPGGLVLLGLSRIFYCAAAITDKCAQVPSLVNSLYSGHDVDSQRQYVVQYIMQSGAGFYVLGVRMDSAVTLKLAYVGGIISLGLMHRVLEASP